MTKKELLNKYKNNEVKAVAVIGISNNCAIEILEVEYGIDDRIIGIFNGQEVFKRKLYYSDNDTFFKLGNSRYSLSEAIRVN